ncbi:MAG: SOS response-associated peptidase family protein [Dehalococcoidia bacterium]
MALADGFFEWRRKGKEKIPTFILFKSREPLAFAGLWETWESPDDEVARPCNVVMRLRKNLESSVEIW